MSAIPGQDPDVHSLGPERPLADVQVGEEVVLARVDGGRQLLHRLTEMGLTPGQAFRVLSRGRPGPFIIMVRQTRLAVGRGMVPRMWVRRPGTSQQGPPHG